MSNRRRTIAPPRSAPASRTPRVVSRPAARRWGLPAAVVAAVTLAVTAEAGHLAAAYLEWPGSATRGAYHVVAGAALGLVAALLATGPGRGVVAAGMAVAAAGPALWLAGAVLGAPPYRELPVLAAAGIAAGEVGLAGGLFRQWRAARPGS